VNRIVLAGGPSVAGFNLRDLERRGTLYAVNDAALYTKPHVALSVSPPWIIKRLAMLRTLGIPRVYLPDYVRADAMKVDPWGLGCWPSLAWFAESDMESSYSTQRGRLPCDNSGHAALNLALHDAEPGDIVFLLGFDMAYEGERCYWYPNYPWTKNEPRDAHKFQAWRVFLTGLSEANMAAGRVEIYQVTRAESDWLAIFPALSFNDFRAVAPII
jgi:hypothetical protein